MKRVDLHIHTSPCKYEGGFSYSLEVLKEYVSTFKLDIIAITNHNFFDKEQFNEISSNLDCVVFPGVEINLEKGHLLLIAPLVEIEGLDRACKMLESKIDDSHKFISFEDLITIFPNYKNYLLIPHYEKDPKIDETTINKFDGLIKTGEVRNYKKFESVKKDNNSLVPVVFSDFRNYNEKTTEISNLPPKFTYVDINDDSFNVLKNALSDKVKVFSNEDKNSNEFPFLPDGTKASLKLNVIIGKRSSGKTHLLNTVNASKGAEDNIKFIEQFSLTGSSESSKFDELIKSDQDEWTNNYSKTMNDLIEVILKIEDKEITLDKYIESLKVYASKQSLQDSFSKAKLFNEIKFNKSDDNEIEKLIDSIKNILNSDLYKDLIEKYIKREDLIKLLFALCEKNKEVILEKKLKDKTDDIIATIKNKLEQKSSMPKIEELNICELYKNKLIIENFNKVVKEYKKEKEINKVDIGNFKLIVKKIPFINATNLKEQLKIKNSLVEPFKKYNQPYLYIKELKEIGLEISDICKSLVYFDVYVLNKNGNKLSGGERAEFNLLKELQNAHNYDILLLDEPEASFDNLFIKENIIEMIKDISAKTTVFVTTHNNTLGVLLKANKIIYTENNNGVFKVYTGELGSKEFKTVNGDSIISYDTIMNTMEAGEKAYKDRGDIYESFKN